MGGCAGEQAAGDGRLGVDGVGAGHVQGHGVEGGEHAHVGNDGDVVAAVAVAEGRNVDDERDVESRAVLHDGLGVLGDLAVHNVVGLVVVGGNGVLGADADAPAAAHAAALVDGALAVFNDGRAVGTFPGAHTAAHAQVLLDVRLAGVVHFHFAGARAAAHAEVFERAAKARHFVALEVGEGNDDVGVHQRAADLGFLYVLAALYRHGQVVGALQAVGNDGLHTGLEGVKAVLVSAFQVLQGVLAAADVKGVAVGQKGAAAQALDVIAHHPGVLRAQIGEVAGFAKVHFDGDKAVGKVDAFKAGGLH